jgi:nitrite reductase/ring-hydroxylating ferredoxin subunit
MAIVSRELTDEAPVGATISTGAGGARARTPISVPAHRYVTSEFAALEAERLWPRVWQLAGTVDHVADPGDVYEYNVGALSVLIVRGDDGELRAFQNTCRHRGSELCSGTLSGQTEIRCPFHRWSYDLTGRLREVPSRRGFGALANADYGLLPVLVDTWGPLVFVNHDLDAEPLASFLDGVPEDSAFLGLDDFRCTFVVTIALPCNWKTLIDGFSETYHVQGIHREMLGSVDDVNGPQHLWRHHGKLEQRYGLPSPRFREPPDDQAVWESFVEIMGTRAGVAMDGDVGPAPSVPDGQTLRDVLAGMVRAANEVKGLDFSRFSDDELLTMQQYNLFPNVTIVTFPDLLSIVRARPGATPDECLMDVLAFDRHPIGTTAPRAQPMDVTMPEGSELPVGMVLNQDVTNARRAQRGLHQPGFSRITLSSEECRILNLHRNLERWLDITPTEIEGDTGF